jgi:hypothetical protein
MERGGAVDWQPSRPVVIILRSLFSQSTLRYANGTEGGETRRRRRRRGGGGKRLSLGQGLANDLDILMDIVFISCGVLKL